jgi:hypothetical protein
MTGVIDLLDELMAQADLSFKLSDRCVGFVEPRACDGCGQIKPDVDVWAEHSDTGEQVLLCRSCGEA